MNTTTTTTQSETQHAPTLPPKGMILLLALAPMIAAVGELVLDHSSMATLAQYANVVYSRSASVAWADAELVRQVHGHLICSTLLTCIGLLWAAFSYRILSKRYNRAIPQAHMACDATERPDCSAS